jgi:ABC-2 type transport system ATP-binding protein
MDERTVGLEAHGLAVAYGDAQVLHGVDLSVRPGEVYALLGGNGAGKSTMLNAFLGFVRPTSGSVRVAGVDPAADPDGARRRLAYVPENVALYEHLSAIENARYFLTLARQPRDRGAIEAALERAGLQRDAWDRRLGGYSKGMRQKVAIAIATLREAPVLLLDEPTSGLDPRATGDFNRLMADLRGQGVAILMVTHDMIGAVDVADRIGVLDRGRIVREEAASGPDRYDLRALHDHFAPLERAA